MSVAKRRLGLLGVTEVAVGVIGAVIDVVPFLQQGVGRGGGSLPGVDLSRVSQKDLSSGSPQGIAIYR